MADVGICVQCGSDDQEVELNEAGLCENCAQEENGDEMGPVDMSGEMNDEEE